MKSNFSRAVFALILAWAAQSPAQNSLTNNLVAYYPLNGDGVDCAGQNPLLLSNSVFATDRFGNPDGCIAFDGDPSRWCHSQNVVAAGIMDNFTMTLWTKPAGQLPVSGALVNGTNGMMLLMASQGGMTYGGGNKGVGILAGTNGVAIWEHSDVYISYPVITWTNLNDWTQVAVVYTNYQAFLYLNGECVGSQYAGGWRHPSSGEDFSTLPLEQGPQYGGLGLAAWSDGFGGYHRYPYKGLVNDFRIYSRALSDAEVRQLYQDESTSPVSVDLKLFAGVEINGPLGSNCLIQASSDLSHTNWITLTNIVLPTRPYVFIDYSSPTNRQQFYRVVPAQ